MTMVPVRKIVKIALYLAILGALSYGWLQVAMRIRSQITERISEEIREIKESS